MALLAATAICLMALVVVEGKYHSCRWDFATESARQTCLCGQWICQQSAAELFAQSVSQQQSLFAQMTRRDCSSFRWTGHAFEPRERKHRRRNSPHNLRPRWGTQCSWSRSTLGLCALTTARRASGWFPVGSTWRGYFWELLAVLVSASQVRKRFAASTAVATFRYHAKLFRQRGASANNSPWIGHLTDNIPNVGRPGTSVPSTIRTGFYNCH